MKGLGTVNNNGKTLKKGIDVEINDSFWNNYRSLLKTTIIPYQYEALNDRIPDAEPSYSVQNFKIAAGDLQGHHKGAIFQDSDVAKWLEAVGYVLAEERDEELEKKADELIDIIARAQQPDGYLHTYYIIEEPDKRWTNLYDCHELYCAGHMIEAAVSYYKSTGKRKLLDVVCKLADHIDSVFGTEEGKLNGYDSHPEIELALVKLYEVTKNKKYLNLSKYFINQRGQKPNYFYIEWEKRGRTLHESSVFKEPNLYYNQSFAPVKEQDKATGHAVRAVYLYTAMADLARLTNDDELYTACEKLWENITNKQMYITGGIGSTEVGEAFTFDYDLPNDTMYCETCASVGLIFFAKRMLLMNTNAKYADIMEKALFNIVLESMALDGKHYFYVNPLEVWPKASENNPIKKHVKSERQKWFGVSCCPPNVARLLGSLNDYIYTVSNNTIYNHLFIGSKAMFKINGSKVELNQASKLPWDGNVTYKINVSDQVEFSLGLRIPYWTQGVFEIKVNGNPVRYSLENGYIIVNRIWRNGDKVELLLDMKVQLIQSHLNVKANSGKVAIMRGPLVYCLEEVDNGENLNTILIDTKGTWEEKIVEFKGLGELIVLETTGYREQHINDNLYHLFENNIVPTRIKAVPYLVWGNRDIGEMQIWTRYK